MATFLFVQGFRTTSWRSAIYLFGAVAVAGAVGYLESRAAGGRVKTLFHILHWLVFSGFALVAFYFLPHLEGARGAAPPMFIVFFALLPLANAPLDWLSLGLTRGLLRYGLAIGGTWRIAAVSLVDIVLAAALMFPLAAITAAAVCLANWSAVSGGGEPVLPVVPLLDAVRNAPDDPKFYWIYLMLFSTLVPSLIHILCGLVGLALACLQPVFRAAVSAQKFAKDESVEDVTQQTKLRTWYPALAAFGTTLLVAVLYLGAAAVPHARAAAIDFAELLLATAERVAGFFPA